MAKKARLIDATKCMGCKGCQVSCKQWNQLPAVQTEFTGSYENPSDLSPETWSHLKFNEHVDGNDVKWCMSFFSCMHCLYPACVEICPVDAIVKLENGAVRIDQETCIACGACRTACPFDVPRISDAAYKCTFCSDRLANNMATACATACAPGAITFGDLDDKIAEAEARVSALQDRGVANAQIYGKEEVSGLQVIYVLADSPDKYGLPVDPQVSFSAFLWKVALGPVRTVAAVGLAVGALSSWFTLRKAEVEKEKEEAKL